MRTSDKGTAPKNPENERVGETVQAFRERFGFTQDELATETGISRSHLANIEAGRKPLTDRQLAIVARALGLKPIAIKRPDLSTHALAA